MKPTWDASVTENSELLTLPGGMVVGFACKRHDGGFSWHITAVHTKYIVKGYGGSKNMASAKRSLLRAWNKWMVHAGLTYAAEEGANDPVGIAILEKLK